MELVYRGALDLVVQPLLVVLALRTRVTTVALAAPPRIQAEVAVQVSQEIQMVKGEEAMVSPLQLQGQLLTEPVAVEEAVISKQAVMQAA